jgi:hypothetical protein
VSLSRCIDWRRLYQGRVKIIAAVLTLCHAVENDSRITMFRPVTKTRKASVLRGLGFEGCGLERVALH